MTDSNTRSTLLGLAFLGFGDQSCAAGSLEAKRLELWVGGKKQANQPTNKKERECMWAAHLVSAEAKEGEWKEKKKPVISACSFCECFRKLYQTGSEWGRGSRHRLRLPWGCFQS